VCGVQTNWKYINLLSFFNGYDSTELSTT